MDDPLWAFAGAFFATALVWALYLAMQIIHREAVMLANGAYAEARALREACEMISAIRATRASAAACRPKQGP